MNALNSKVVTFIFCALILVGCSKPPVPQVQNEEEIQLAPTASSIAPASLRDNCVNVPVSTTVLP